jgi:Ca-activated chloride channel family protein
MKPTGWTPIANSLEKAQQILSQYSGDGHNNSIILVSDGKETCDGNPIDIAKKLKASQLNVIINVIGFDVGGEDERQLQEVANSGGGDYFSVKKAIDFEYAFEKHKAFMKEFDYKINNVSMQLEDIGKFSDQYFECLMSLKEQEAKVMLDIYAEDIINKECGGYVEEKYYSESYNKMENDLKNKFDNTMSRWREASALSGDAQK